MHKFLIVIFLIMSLPVAAETGSRLVISGGVTGFEGTGGGGITPWAFISGYGSREQIKGTSSLQSLDTGEYQLKTVGASIGIYDRVEISVQRQILTVSSSVVGNVFDLLTSGGVVAAPGTAIEQTIFGVKAKVYGDAIFAKVSWQPQVSLGILYKKNHDFDTSLALVDGTIPLPSQGVPAILGAKDDSGVDIYLSTTKYWLGGAMGNNLLLNVTARLTKANTFGLLGFSSTTDDDYELEVEGSIVMVSSPQTAIGVEWRTQTNRLGGLAEEKTITDFFIAYFPNKSLSITGAYVDIGNLPFNENASGLYLSVTANL